jgi:dephospho-CoA kinase
MMIVALTGGLGCGKSEATRHFAKLGVPIVDLDIISHALTTAKQPIMNMIATTFGQEYLTAEGALNRSKMRELVFNNIQARGKLNAILHPAIYHEAKQQLSQHQHAPYIILAIPLLEQDSPYIAIIDRILVIDCDERTQIERVKQRSNLSEAEIKQIIQAQPTRQARQKMANDLITNDNNIQNLYQKIENLHQKYIKTCIVNKTIS